MKYYVFKFNAGAYTVASFEGKIDSLKDHILNTLSFAVNITKEQNMYKIDIDEDEENRYKNFMSRYEEIVDLTKSLYDEYEDIIKKYREDGSVLYSNEFITLNKKCGVLRNGLVRDFSFLINAEKIDDEYIIKHYNIPLEKPVGTAITHIKKFSKIQYYIKNNQIKDFFNDISTVYYDDKNEQIIIGAMDEEEAVEESKRLMHIFNNNSFIEEHIGKVSILPIYSSIKIIGKVKKIIFTIVYPNGSEERNNIILTQRLKALEADKVKIEASSDEGLNLPGINIEINEVANKGYLESIDSIRGGSYQSVIQTTDLFDLSGSEEDGGL